MTQWGIEVIGPDDWFVAESLQDELSRLSDYVDQCLLLATAEQRRLTLRSESLSLSALVREMIETYELLARESARQLKVTMADDVVVSADPRYLRQMLHTLLTNALRHGKGAIQVTVAREAGRAYIRVSNAVSGQAPAAAPGTGLGLRIVRALAALDPHLTFQGAEQAGHFTAELRWAAPN